MAIDFDTLLLDPIYALDVFGVAAVLRTSYGQDINLTVLDKTEGVMLESQHGGQLFGAAKIAACVRVTELDANSVARDSLKGATLTFKGQTWRIVATQPKPKPGGKGELYLILQTP